MTAPMQVFVCLKAYRRNKVSKILNNAYFCEISIRFTYVYMYVYLPHTRDDDITYLILGMMTSLLTLY